MKIYRVVIYTDSVGLITRKYAAETMEEVFDCVYDTIGYDGRLLGIVEEHPAVHILHSDPWFDQLLLSNIQKPNKKEGE